MHKKQKIQILKFVDDYGNIVGIDAEIASALAEKLDMDLEIKDMKFQRVWIFLKKLVLPTVPTPILY